MYHVGMKPAYIYFIAFLHIFCMYVDSLHVFPFRQPSAGHMALPTGAMLQCHNKCGPTCKMEMKVTPH